MNDKIRNKNSFLNIFIVLFFMFQRIKFAIPQLLNNIIRLGEDNLRYIHFSFNSNGDMIIDSSAYPISDERKFFGLKKNGRFFFFNDTNNKETPFYSLTANHNRGRIEGESHFIKLTSNNSEIHGRELICGISKSEDSGDGYFVEIYNLNDKNMTNYYTPYVFGNLITDSFIIPESVKITAINTLAPSEINLISTIV